MIRLRAGVENQPPGCGVRHVQCFLLFFCLTVTYALRVNLSVAVVAMVDKKNTNPDFPEYKWNEKTRSVVLSSFFWGYVVTQVPAGYLSQRVGSRLMLLYGLLICSLLAILTPICAAVGDWYLVCGLRVIQGLAQGVIFPSTHNLLAKWAPINERGKLGTYSYTGAQFGTVLMLASSGIIASSPLGWPGIFYISGAAGILWSILWYFHGANSPSQHKHISAEEKTYIESSLGEDTHASRNLKTPWKKFFTSMPFISLIMVHCSHNWGFWTLLTEMPTYMKFVLEMDIKSNALLSALPYLAMCILSIFFSAISDVLTRKECISIHISRKLFNSIGHWIPMCSLIGLAYVTKENTGLAIGLLTVTVGCNAATYLGFQVNHIDLSPNFAGTLMGITNCAANIMSTIAPLAVGHIVSDDTNPAQWRIVFFIAAGIYLFGNLMFLIFGRTNIQKWNSPDGDQKRLGPSFMDAPHN